MICKHCGRKLKSKIREMDGKTYFYVHDVSKTSFVFCRNVEKYLKIETFYNDRQYAEPSLKEYLQQL